MARRNRIKPEIKYPEIAVFAFSKGSQMNENVPKSESYYFMLDKIEQIMRMNNVKSSKFGISGYKEDVAAYLAFYLAVYQNKDLEVRLMDDINEYDPDIVPDNYRKASFN
jgi:hypothetical protein